MILTASPSMPGRRATRNWRASAPIQAADRALGLFANREAVRYYKDALEMDLIDSERTHVLDGLGRRAVPAGAVRRRGCAMDGSCQTVPGE